MDKYKALVVETRKEGGHPTYEKEWNAKKDMINHFKAKSDQEPDLVSVMVIEWKQYKAIENFIIQKHLANRTVKMQTLEDNCLVVFDSKGLVEDFKQVGIDTVPYDMAMATIQCLATFSELGNLNSEYYDIRFEDGMIFHAVSGYHLGKLHKIPPIDENIKT